MTKNSFDFSTVTCLVTFAKDLHHQWLVTNSNRSFISLNSCKKDQISKIFSQARLLGQLLTWWCVYDTGITWSVITESPKGGPLNVTCQYRPGGRLFYFINTLVLHCASLLHMILASSAHAHELNSEINAPFLLNKHSDPHFLFHNFNENNILNIEIKISNNL